MRKLINDSQLGELRQLVAVAPLLCQSVGERKGLIFRSGWAGLMLERVHHVPADSGPTKVANLI